MIRKEIKNETGKNVYYIVNDDINVSVIISELSAMGCKGDELGNAYRKLISDDKGYLYENSDTKETLLVIDEKYFKGCDFGRNAFLPLIWMFFMIRMLNPNPSGDFLQDLKKGGEVI